MTEHKQCDCQLCQQNRTFREKLALIPEDVRPYFENLYDHLLETSFDQDYYRAIMSGSWPGAVEVLERALEKARASRARLEAEQ